MRKKRKNLWKIIKGIRKQSICMQQRLIVYWCVVILTLFLATVLLLSIIGVLPGMDFKVREMLSAQQKNTVSAMTEQTDIMMARSISLSEEITKELSQYLTANGKAFSDLNDNPQLIMDLEAALYSSLRSALDVKYCRGVFVKTYIEERAMEIARYIIDNNTTVRQAAKHFGISKSTVHKDVTERLVKINPFLAARIRVVLDVNKAERHIRGGMATKEKYLHEREEQEVQ